MAKVATVQALIDQDDDEEIRQTLQLLQAAALNVPGVRALRVTDAQGQPLCSMSTTASIEETRQCVLDQPFFVLPANCTVMTDPRESGTLVVRVLAGVEDLEGIDVAIQVDAELVTSRIVPTSMSPDKFFAEHRYMHFEEAERLREAERSPPTLAGAKLIDHSTGTPVAGVAMLVPAVARFDSVTRLASGKLSFTGLALDATFEERAFPYLMRNNATGGSQQMFYSSTMQLIGADRMRLDSSVDQPLGGSGGRGSKGGPDKSG